MHGYYLGVFKKMEEYRVLPEPMDSGFTYYTTQKMAGSYVSLLFVCNGTLTGC